MIYTSDPLSRIAPRRRKLFEFVRPVGIMRPDLPLRESESPVIAMHHRLEDRHILFLFNPDGAPQTVYASLEELCGCRELYLTAWEDGWNAGQSPCFHWGGTIPPHGCVLLYGGETGPVTEIRSLWQPQ